MSSPKESKPPQPPVPEDNVPATANVASPEVIDGKTSISGQDSAKPATERLVAFALSAQDVKAAAAKEITKTTAAPVPPRERKFWKRAQREKQAELDIQALLNKPVSYAKRRTSFEEGQREKQGELDLEAKRLLNQSFLQDMVARQLYARQIFILITSWLSAILLILLLQGFSSRSTSLFVFHWLGSQWKIGNFYLSDPVLLALIGGTTASVLGLFTIVAKYIFPEKKG